MSGIRKLLFGALSLLLLTGCGASRTDVKVDPTGRTVAVLPVADYSFIEDVEIGHRKQLIVNSYLAAALADKGFKVSPQPVVYRALTDFGFIRPMSYEHDIKQAVDNSSLENLLNEDWSDMMKSEIVKMTKIETRRRIPGIAVQDSHLPAPDTTILNRQGAVNLGRELGAEYLLRSRLLVYDMRQEYPWDPLRRQTLPFFEGRHTLQQFGIAKALHYDPLDNIVVGGSLTNLGIRNEHAFRLQVWLQDAVTGDVAWTRQVIKPIIEDEFADAVRKASEELMGNMVKSMAKDDDGDGVLNHRDRCPDSPRGEPVDTYGCPPGQEPVPFEEIIPAEEYSEQELITEDIDPNTDDWPEFSEDQEILSNRISFDFDSAAIKPSYHGDLEKIAHQLNSNPEAFGLIEGHTDEEGTANYNLKLSRRRADAAQAYLVKSFGVDKSRLKTIGFGKSRPIADNRTPEGREQNRRVEVTITRLE
jgi:outer membrane protein OmpA-like peptidoglycan-associated protein